MQIRCKPGKGANGQPHITIIRTQPDREPIGVARLDTTHAVRVSNVLPEGAKLHGEETVRRWLGAWCTSGFHLLEQKAVARLEEPTQSTLVAATVGSAISLPADVFDGLGLPKGAVVVYIWHPSLVC
jgi:hypothetical protein